MKILILVDNLGSGGMQAQLVNLINGIKKRGHEIQLVLYHPGDDKGFFCDSLDISSTKITRLGASGGFRFMVAKYICLQSCRHDVILSFLHSANFYVTCAKIMNFFLRKNKNFFNIVVDMSSFGNRKAFRLSVMSFFSMLFANRVISNSETQNSYYQALPGGKSKSLFIPNGVDSENFFKPYKKWESEDRDFYLVVGRVSRAKNGPAFVQALREFSIKSRRAAKVIWVGRFDNDPMAKDDKEQMDDLIAKMISEKNLDWTWAGEVENVDWYYKNARCLIIPSRWEGVPNVLIEAMLAGCPIISTPVSDIPYILGDSNCGIVCEGVEPRHISSGIQLFDELEPQAIDDMRLRAQQYAVENFSIDNMTDKYIQAINEVCL